MFDRERFVSDLYALAERAPAFLRQGKSLDTGFDCVNGLRYCYELQQALPEDLAREFDAYNVRPDGWRMLRIIREWFTEISEDEMMPGDIYSLYNRKNPCHVAARVKDNPVLIAEAYESLDGSVSKFLIRPLDPRQRIAGCFRIPF